jgi:hypothetical protein
MYFIDLANLLADLQIGMFQNEAFFDFQSLFLLSMCKTPDYRMV